MRLGANEELKDSLSEGGYHMVQIKCSDSR